MTLAPSSKAQDSAGFEPDYPAHPVWLGQIEVQPGQYEQLSPQSENRRLHSSAQFPPASGILHG